MSFYSTISEGIKDAMRSKDKERLSALRDIKSKLILEATKTGAEAESIDDATAFSILNKLYKQRNESAEIYQEQKRPDLESEERAQAAVIAEFLPAQLSEDEIAAKVASIISQMGASSMADMGKVMGRASGEMAGKADGKLIAQFVKSQLQNQ
ncbi:GatB/YqeY domain-containing protein [Flavobacteriales bacterium]|nr:GatB/YqeY domain-containing protein [Flavobacteriales bacterium]|tara:strand:+ start:419 stop:877 length:459 start_codon:yes stop_codon:yes gene_type:complete